MPRQKIKLVILLLLLFCLLPLTGCWSRVEVNDRAFVTGMYVDYTDDGMYEVSLGFPLPNRITAGGSLTIGSGGGGGNPYALVSKKGESIAVAIRKIRSDMSGNYRGDIAEFLYWVEPWPSPELIPFWSS